MDTILLVHPNSLPNAQYLLFHKLLHHNYHHYPSHNFKISEYQPGVIANSFHPWCRTSTIPYFENNTTHRLARDPLTGKRESVSGDLPYKDWYQKNVVERYGQNEADVMRRRSKMNLATLSNTRDTRRF